MDNMHADCEDCVKRDICTRDVPKPCKYKYTEEERIADQASDIYGAILAGMYLPKTYLNKKEDNKMNATSTEYFKDIIEINFELQTFPSTGEQDKFIITATNRDDIFAFEFEGPYLADTCRRAGLLTGWEKDQRIRELKEEYEDKIEELRHKCNLERGANETLRKFFRKYAGEGTEIEFNHTVGDDEVTYMIVDKEEYKALKNCDCKVRLHGMDFTRDELVNRILELEALKTIEKLANEEPSSRADILDQAKKCVCGHREQDYGSPESNFQLIADLWNQYLFKEPGAKEVFGIGPMDVSMMMALMKIARIRNGGGSGDSFVDLAGYAACGGEIWHLNKEIPGDSSQETN